MSRDVKGLGQIGHQPFFQTAIKAIASSAGSSLAFTGSVHFACTALAPDMALYGFATSVYTATLVQSDENTGDEACNGRKWLVPVDITGAICSCAEV